MNSSPLRDARGQALVEFVVVTPLMLLLVFGVATFGIVLNNNIVLTDAVRTGARQLAVSRGVSNPCDAGGTKTRASAITLRLTNVTLTTTVNGNVYTASAGGIPTCSGQGVTMVSGADVVMLGTYPCTLVVMGINFAPSCVLTAQTTARVE